MTDLKFPSDDLRRRIESMDPPKEPTEDEPGPLASALVEMFGDEEVTAETAIKMVTTLAGMLDMRDCLEEKRRYESAQGLLNAATCKRPPFPEIKLITREDGE